MTRSFTSYDGGVVTTPRRVVRPRSVEELRAVLRDRDAYPGPVRAMGSFHSLTPCAATDGTLISTAPSESDRPAWERFLREFNRWAHDRGGIPLLNQSPFIGREDVTAAYGERWAEFSRWVRGVDPERRMVNAFFDQLLV